MTAKALRVGTCLTLLNYAKKDQGGSDAVKEAKSVDCAQPHIGEVYASVALKPDAALTTAGGRTKALDAVDCPDVDKWTGYTGTLATGVLEMPRLTTPTNGPVQCVAIGIDYPAKGMKEQRLRVLVGSLKGTITTDLDVVRDWLMCSKTHKVGGLVERCKRGSTQWVYLRSYPKPSGPYPGDKVMKKRYVTYCEAAVQPFSNSNFPQWWAFYSDRKSWASATAQVNCWAPLKEITYPG